MHELGIADEVLAVALAEAARHGAAAVCGVRLRVGVLRAVEPEHLAFLFEHLAHGTAAEGALLEVDAAPVRVACGSCGPSVAYSAVWECPRCRGSDIEVTGGDALEIVSLDIR